jgi:hypothetical protein
MQIKLRYLIADRAVDNVDIAAIEPLPMIRLDEVSGKDVGLFFGDSMTESDCA